MHDVGPHVPREPRGELFHLPSLVAALPLERRDRERPQVGGPGRAGAVRQPFEQPARVEQRPEHRVEHTGQVAERRDVLVEPDVHAPHDDPPGGDVLLVRGRGHVGRQEDRVAAPRPQAPHERVVVQARSAQAAAGAGRDVHDPHGGACRAGPAAARPSRWTSTSVRSAGVMPRTRPACPSVSGRIRSNCSRASARRCRTLA